MTKCHQKFNVTNIWHQTPSPPPEDVFIVLEVITYVLQYRISNAYITYVHIAANSLRLHKCAVKATVFHYTFHTAFPCAGVWAFVTPVPYRSCVGVCDAPSSVAGVWVFVTPLPLRQVCGCL